MEYNLPPDDGVLIGGRIFVIDWVHQRFYKKRWKTRAYAVEYRNSMLSDYDEFGVCIDRSKHDWVNFIFAGGVFVTEAVYDRQDNKTKTLMQNRCRCVVPNDWHPFHGHPDDPYDVEVQNQDIIWGYISVHFNNLSKINGEYCIPDGDSVIIDSGSWHEVSSKKNKKKRWVAEFVSIEDVVTSKITDGNITARIDITLKWHYKSRDRDSNGMYSYNNKTSTATFYDTVSMPRVLNIPMNASATIVSYNNSVAPYSLIDVHIDENVTTTKITYRNQTATHHNKIGLLETTDDLKHFNFIDEGIWKPDQNNTIAFRAGYYVINAAPLSDIQIDVSTPYQTYTITDYNVTVIDSKPTDHIGWKSIIAFMSLLGVFGFGIWYTLRRYV